MESSPNWYICKTFPASKAQESCRWEPTMIVRAREAVIWCQLMSPRNVRENTLSIINIPALSTWQFKQVLCLKNQLSNSTWTFESFLYMNHNIKKWDWLETWALLIVRSVVNHYLKIFFSLSIMCTNKGFIQ